MLTGYSDRLSIRPTETIQFLVSTDSASFDLEIVRLFHGDSDERGPGRKEVQIDCDAAGKYPGIKQSFPFGSYVHVTNAPGMELAGSFSFFVWVWPTMVKHSRQVIFSNINNQGEGFSLAINSDGYTEVCIDGQKFVSESQLLERRWQWVALTAENNTRSIEVAIGLNKRHQDYLTHTRTKFQLADDFIPCSNDVFMATESTPNGPRFFFNGKIARPSLFRRKLSYAEISLLVSTQDRLDQDDHCIAAWDFSKRMETSLIVDISRGGHHGQSIQRPVRAMTGPDWDGTTTDYRLQPEQYDAIHFHEDSLDDAAWDPAASFTVPVDFPSGIYAARIRTRSEIDYLPFIVCPPAGKPTGKTLFLAPSFTYLAYGNENYREYGLNSAYDHYIDGAGVPFGPMRVPMASFRPDRGIWQAPNGKNFGRHLCSDLYFIDWANEQDENIDILTDHEIHEEGASVLSQYQLVITGSHPEYVSDQILNALETYLAQGGNLMYLGGNGFYYATSLDAEGKTIEIRRPNGSRPWMSEPGEGNHEMTGEPGGMWRFRGRAPQQLTGIGFTAQGWRGDGYCGYGRAYDLSDTLDDPVISTLLDGIDRSEQIGNFDSLTLGFGAASDEIDRTDPGFGTPCQTRVIASATGFSTDYQHVVEERVEINDESTRPNNERVRSDIVYFNTPFGGKVFSVGSIGWFSCLSFNNYDNNVSRLTLNVLRHFISTDEGGKVRTTQQSPAP